MRTRPVLTLRGRTTLLAVALVTLVLGAGAMTLVTVLEDQLVAGADEVSRTRARDLMALASDDRLPATLRQVDDDAVAQVFGTDGRVRAASDNIRGRGPITSPAEADQLVLRTFRGPDDAEAETYRAWVVSGTTSSGDVTVVVGSSLEAIRETTVRLRALLLVGVPLAAAVLGLVVWWLVGHALRRLDRIRAEVDDIGPAQLGRRIDERGPDDEVSRLARTMNRMLARLEAASSRQRRFVADVSHDLQSPLAGQRLALELALRAPGHPDLERLRTEVLARTAEMERLVGDLLVLAAADEGAAATVTDLDLDVVVLEEAARARTHADVEIHTAHVSAGPVRADPDEVRRIVRNLIDNAVAHASTTVDLVVGATGATVVLDVVDDGPGVPCDERALVFERFHRGDPSRTRGAAGHGLGLAIVRALVGRAGGRVELLDEPGGAHFRVSLPLAPTD